MKTHLMFGVLVVAVAANVAGATGNEALPDGNAVAAKVAAQDTQRQALSAGYHGMRHYVLDNERMHKHAEIVVRVECGADGIKHFELVSQNGWKGAYKHVVSKMLASEAEASQSETKLKTRLGLDNYEFHMVRSALLDDRMAYVVDIIPRRNEERLIKGQAWIDAQDYAVVRIEGEPARTPSFWIRSVHFVHTYWKNGPNWFPASTESVTEVRIFGATTLTISYFDYTPNLPLSPESARARTEPPGGDTP
jgi:hypothetical protein